MRGALFALWCLASALTGIVLRTLRDGRPRHPIKCGDILCTEDHG